MSGLSGGLVFGFVFTPEGAERTAEPLAERPSEPGRFSWLHLNLAHPATRSWIATAGDLPRYARELLLDMNDHPRLISHETTFGGVLVDVRNWLSTPEREVGTFRFYTERHLVITGRHEPLETLNEVRRDIEGGLRIQGPAALTALILRRLAASLDGMVDELEARLDELEPLVWQEERPAPRKPFSAMRLTALKVSRQIALKRHAVMQLCEQPPAWFATDDVARLREAIDHLSAVADDLVELHDRAKVLQEEVASRLAEQTNRNLYVISVVTAVLLPQSLITGLFGMNVGGLPGVGTPSGFLWVMLLMAGSTVVTLICLRLLRLL